MSRIAFWLAVSAAYSTTCMAGDDKETPAATTVLPLTNIDASLGFQTQKCAASLSLSYYQKGEYAHVESTLENSQCAASSGSYVIRVRYRPDEGEMTTVEFEETWGRDDDADVIMEKDYYIGEDLEIRRVSSTKVKCECAEPVSNESPSGGESYEP